VNGQTASKFPVRYLLASVRNNMKGYPTARQFWILSERAKAVASGSKSMW
jgi:hypothetical protein